VKIIANDYEPKEIIRVIREWSELTQKEFGKTIHRSEKGIQAFELGTRNYDMRTLIQIAKVHGLKITIEKKEK
jgi:DNA-binding XRE family transcriptional regulator